MNFVFRYLLIFNDNYGTILLVLMELFCPFIQLFVAFVALSYSSGLKSLKSLSKVKYIARIYSIDNNGFTQNVFLILSWFSYRNFVNFHRELESIWGKFYLLKPFFFIFKLSFSAIIECSKWRNFWADVDLGNSILEIGIKLA